MAETCDCIVLGLGAMGSAALDHVARRGARVIGIEQFTAAHDRGSSHGQTRMIRRAYFEHPDYVPLVDRAFQHWFALQQELGRTLYQPTGLVVSGSAAGEVVPGTLTAARQHQLPIRELTSDECARRFPQFRFPVDDTVVFEEDCGFLFVEDCVQAQIDRAVAAGATASFEETVREWTSHNGTIRVVTSRGAYEADRLIITAGAWASRVLGELGLSLQVRRKVQFWFPVAEDGVAAHRTSPSFIFERPDAAFYGFPSIDERTVKVAEHTGGRVVDDPSALDRNFDEGDLGPVRRFLELCLPHLGTEPERHSVCMYTMSPDGHFLVDRHPLHQNVVLAAGFSGHGFKFAPVMGEALADLALTGETDLPIEFLRLGRLGR